MQASQKHKISRGPGRFYIGPVQNLESSCLPPSECLDSHSSSDNSSHACYPLVQTSEQQYSTLKSSTNRLARRSSPSTIGVSPNDSPVSKLESKSYVFRPKHSLDIINGSPEGDPRLTGDLHHLRHKIREVKNAMLGSEVDMVNIYYDVVIPTECDQLLSEAEKWREKMEMISRDT